jgi:hypothetical protein
MNALQTWLVSFALTLVVSGVGVVAMRYSCRLPIRATSGIVSIPTSMLLNFPIYGIGIVVLGLAWKVASAFGVEPTALLPVAAMAGWAACWARGLERYADDRLGSRSVATPQIEASLLPFGVLLLGVLSLITRPSATDAALTALALLPPYLAFSCWVFRLSYPNFTLDRRTLGSEAWKHGIGFAVVGGIATALVTYVPFLGNDYGVGVGYWFVGYVAGSWLEGALRQRLNERFEASQPMALPQAPPQVAVSTSEYLPTITVGRSTSQNP